MACLTTIINACMPAFAEVWQDAPVHGPRLGQCNNGMICNVLCSLLWHTQLHMLLHMACLMLFGCVSHHMHAIVRTNKNIQTNKYMERISSKSAISVPPQFEELRISNDVAKATWALSESHDASISRTATLHTYFNTRFWILLTKPNCRKSNEQPRYTTTSQGNWCCQRVI